MFFCSFVPRLPPAETSTRGKYQNVISPSLSLLPLSFSSRLFSLPVYASISFSLSLYLFIYRPVHISSSFLSVCISFSLHQSVFISTSFLSVCLSLSISQSVFLSSSFIFLTRVCVHLLSVSLFLYLSVCVCISFLFLFISQFIYQSMPLSPRPFSSSFMCVILCLTVCHFVSPPLSPLRHSHFIRNFSVSGARRRCGQVFQASPFSQTFSFLFSLTLPEPAHVSPVNSCRRHEVKQCMIYTHTLSLDLAFRCIVFPNANEETNPFLFPFSSHCPFFPGRV